MDQPIVDQEQGQVQDQSQGADPGQGASDVFALDEAKLASLSPEQRAALDPIFDDWKTRAKSEIEKTGKTYEEKYKPVSEKAQALDMLVKDQRFVQWWQGVQGAATRQNPAGAGAISQSRPQDFATPEEWNAALSDWAQGDPTKFQALQVRSYQMLASPVVQQIQQGQQELRTTLEMRDLFDRHPDAKELDAIGRNATDPNDKAESLLESCLNWAQENNRPLEDGYERARSWANSLKVGAQKQAMGLVQDKKQSVTSGPANVRSGGMAVVEVADIDELMQKQMEASLDGNKNIKFVIRPPAAQSQGRWAQKN